MRSLKGYYGVINNNNDNNNNNIPAPEDAPRAAVESPAAALAARRAPTAEEAVHLVDEHLERAVAILDAVGPRESVRGGQDAVGVDARLAVQAMPHDRRQIEQHRLRTHASPQYG